MQTATKGQRVWVSILPARSASDGPRTAGTVEPIALVPGIVTEATIMTREVPGRQQPIQRAVQVLSFHRMPDGREFYREQGQGLIGLVARDTYAPVIDGPEDATMSRDWYLHLLAKVAESQGNIVLAPSEALLAAAVAEFGVHTEPEPDKATAKAKTGAQVPAFA